MSKTSYGLIALMIIALLYMGAVRGYQFYEQKAEEWEQQRQESADAFSFQQVPISLAAPQAEEMQAPVRLPADLTSISILPEKTKSSVLEDMVDGAGVPVFSEREIFLEDAPLSAPQQIRQAQDTLRSIVQDYQNEPEIQSFNQELKKVTAGKAVDLSSLGGGDLKQVLKDNPQIQSIISKHMQNPDFARKVQQIFSNPQFVQSVRQLQQAGMSAQAANKKN